MLLWTGTRKILKYCHELPGGSSDFPTHANNAQGEKGDVLVLSLITAGLLLHHHQKNLIARDMW